MSDLDIKPPMGVVLHLESMVDKPVPPDTSERKSAERKLVRKLDLRLMPMIMMIYFLNYLDRNNIAAARLGTLEKDTGLVGTQYNTIISIFFVGYILTQVPANMILKRVRPSIFLPVVMCCWATVSASCGAAQSYSGLVILRFCLGFVEAPFFPGCLFLLSSWYTKKELAARISILYAAGLISGAFGGLLGSAIMSHMGGKAGLSAWRWLFIIEGTATISFAVLAMFVLPDYPATTKWLSEAEKTLAILRIQEEASDEDNDVSVFTGLRLAFTDPAMYVIWLMQLGLNTAASFTNFFPTIVHSLGYSTTITLLLTAPPYVFSALLGILNSMHSDETKERWIHVMWPQLLCITGFIISATTLEVGARYTAMFLMMGIYGSFGVILSWVATSLPRPSSKRAVAYAFVNAGSNLASIYSSYFYPKSDGPAYVKANIINIVFSCTCISMATILRFGLKRRNNKLDKFARDGEQETNTTIGPNTIEYCSKLNIHPEYRYQT